MVIVKCRKYLCFARYENGVAVAFLALTVWMVHDQRNNIRDYWSRDEQQTTPFFS
jgi:hypothetical protein